MATELFEVKIETSLGGFAFRSSDFTGPPAPTNPIAAIALAFVRPRVEIDTPFGSKTIQDHGAPFSPIVGWAIVAGVVALITFAIKKGLR